MSPRARSRSTRIARRRCSPLCRPRHQAACAPGRWRHQGPAAVHHRSRRHRAGAERLHHGDDRDEQGAVRARARRDPEQARRRSVRGQGGAAEGCSASRGQFGAAQNDLRSSQTALDASRDKLKILGFNEAAIDTFRQKGGIADDSTTVNFGRRGSASARARRMSKPITASFCNLIPLRSCEAVLHRVSHPAAARRAGCL